jgi:hypothetical protein
MAAPEDDLDEFAGHHLLNSLHLAPAEEEPVRRGAASRANSVRFDESALQSSTNWGGHSTRHSGEFVRPGSGLMMERSLSHKSDGRHSSAGHSVHSLHSAPSGRASSSGGREDDSPVDVPEPPPGLIAMGSVPSIIRCWLTPNKFTHSTLLYADICTGSQRSSIAYSLLKELGYAKDMEKDADGIYRIRLPVFLAEAIVSQPSSRSASPSHEIYIPRITVMFDVLGVDAQPESTETKAIHIFIGCDALRTHSADVLLSRNQMVLYGDDRSKLVVHFVRPEDEATFKHIYTASIVPERPRLNATAPPFVSNGQKPAPTASPALSSRPDQDDSHDGEKEDLDAQQELVSPTSLPPPATAKSSNPSENGGDDRTAKSTTESESGKEAKGQGTSAQEGATDNRRESGSGIWGSWRAAANGGDGRDGPLSGYQPATRGSRSMKVLKPTKPSLPSPSSARTGASYEPAPPLKKDSDRRKSGQGLLDGPSTPSTASTQSPMIRWSSKRALSISGEARPPQPLAKEVASRGPTTPNMPRSTNPVGGASAFSWMKDSSAPAQSA